MRLWTSWTELMVHDFLTFRVNFILGTICKLVRRIANHSPSNWWSPRSIGCQSQHAQHWSRSLQSRKWKASYTARRYQTGKAQKLTTIYGLYDEDHIKWIIKRNASSLWLFCPISVWVSIETTTIRKTHPTLWFGPYEPFILSYGPYHMVYG